VIPVHVVDAAEEMKQVQKHPKVSRPGFKDKSLLLAFSLLVTGFVES